MTVLPFRTTFSRHDAVFVLFVIVAVVLVLGPPLFSSTQLLYSHDVNYFYAHEVVLRDGLARDDFPHWNPYFGGGEPGLSKLQIGIFYPPIAILRALFTPVVMFNLDVALHLIIAGLGVYSLLRDWRVQPVAATFGALVFCLSSAFIPRILAGHASVIHTIAWMGWLLLVYRRLLYTRSWSYLLLTIILVALTVLGGHPQMSAIALVVPAVYFVAFAVSRAKAKGWRELVFGLLVSAVAGIVAATLTAIQLVPFAAFLAETSRGAGQAEVVERMTDHSFLLHDVVRLFLPHIFTDVAGPAVIGATGQGNFWEKSAFVGILPLFVLGLAAWNGLLGRERRIIFLAVLALLGLTLSMGTVNPLYKLAAQYGPYFRAPGRFLVLWAFALAALSGIALDRLPALEQRRPAYREWLGRLSAHIAALTLLATALFIIWALFWDRLLFGFNTSGNARAAFQVVADTVNQAAVPFVATLVLIVVLLWLAVRRVVTWKRWRVLVLIGLFAELFLYSRFAIAAHPVSELHDPGHPLARLAPPASEVRLDGHRTPPVYLVPTLDHVSNGEERIALESLLALPDDKGLLLLAAGYEATLEPLGDPLMELIAADGGAYLYRRAGTVPRLYAAPSLRVVKSDEAALNLVARPSFRPDQQAVVTVPGGAVPTGLASLQEQATEPLDFEGTITQYENNSVRAQVSVDRPALIVFTEMYDPGWAATVDSSPTPLWLANYAFRGVLVDAGTHTIEMRFTSAPFRLGLAITIATAAGLSLATLVLAIVSRQVAQPRMRATRNRE